MSLFEYWKEALIWQLKRLRRDWQSKKGIKNSYYQAVNSRAFPSSLAIFVITVYKAIFSPWMGGCCRYIPSCSEYALQSFKIHPFLKALYFSLKRISRCHPFACFGYDPVPGPVCKRGCRDESRP